MHESSWNVAIRLARTIKLYPIQRRLVGNSVVDKSLSINPQESESITSTELLAYRFAATLFHLELDSRLEQVGDRYVGPGRIICLVNLEHPVVQSVLVGLLIGSLRLWLDDYELSFRDDQPFLTEEGNFQKHVHLNVKEIFTIEIGHRSLRENSSISGSPYSAKTLTAASNRRKRKNENLCEYPRKR